MLYNAGVDKFTALADPTRRSILELLAVRGQMTAGEIHSQFEMSAPAISQHLKVLLKADLIKVEKRAQQRLYRLNPEGMYQVEDWLGKFAAEVEARNRRLDELLARELHKQTERDRTSRE